jgi:predicted transcriptional regulator
MAKAVSVKLEDADRERLSQLAAKTRRTPHYLMREAVLSFLDREEKRIAFREEAEAAWADYKETGLHLTLDDMEAWSKASPAAPLRPWRKSS